MISIIDSGKLVNTEVSPMVPRSCEMVGLSTDTKPTGVSVGNGWSFIEMDTGKVFFYNAADEEWLEFAGSGGGSGQGGSNVLVINMDNGTLDKTWQEIADAYSAGKTVVLINDTTEQGARTIMAAYVAMMESAGGASLSLVYVERQNNQGVISYSLAGMDFVADSADGYPVINAGE